MEPVSFCFLLRRLLYRRLSSYHEAKETTALSACDEVKLDAKVWHMTYFDFQGETRLLQKINVISD